MKTVLGSWRDLQERLRTDSDGQWVAHEATGGTFMHPPYAPVPSNPIGLRFLVMHRVLPGSFALVDVSVASGVEWSVEWLRPRKTPPDLVAFLRPLLLRAAEDCGLEEAEFVLEVQRLPGRSDS